MSFTVPSDQADRVFALHNAPKLVSGEHRQLNCLEVYAGAGGTSFMANHGQHATITTRWAVDIFDDAVVTFATNHPETSVWPRLLICWPVCACTVAVSLFPIPITSCSLLSETLAAWADSPALFSMCPQSVIHILPAFHTASPDGGPLKACLRASQWQHWEQCDVTCAQQRESEPVAKHCSARFFIHCCQRLHAWPVCDGWYPT